jgi:hypothetical protein
MNENTNVTAISTYPAYVNVDTNSLLTFLPLKASYVYSVAFHPSSGGNGIILNEKRINDKSTNNIDQAL